MRFLTMDVDSPTDGFQQEIATAIKQFIEHQLESDLLSAVTTAFANFFPASDEVTANRAAGMLRCITRKFAK